MRVLVPRQINTRLKRKYLDIVNEPGNLELSEDIVIDISSPVNQTSENDPIISITNKTKRIRATKTISKSSNYIGNQLNTSKWFSASSVHNYMLGDPILDWLKHNKNAQLFPSEQNLRKKALSSMNNEKHFFSFLMDKGREFENAVMNYIGEKIGVNNIAKVAFSVEDIIDVKKYEETLDHMKKGTPLIYQGVLHNADNNTYGSPDIIIRSDWLNVLTPHTINNTLAKTPSPVLNENYHYCVIDIKFTTLKLRADGEFLLNSGRNKCNKAQTIIYNMALGKLQGYTPRFCYILGRGYSYSRGGSIRKSGLCDKKLGKIDCEVTDAHYIEKINSAIAWLKDLRKNGHNWDVYPEPDNTHLYPNMSNKFDAPFHTVKQEIADNIDEITKLWGCGVKERNNAMAHGVTNFMDARCTTEIMGITSEKKKLIVDRMLEINRPECNVKIMPSIITNNEFNWQNPNSKLEFYIDFENITNVVDDFKQIPHSNGISLVFMIGLGYVKNGKWCYHGFTAYALTPLAEYKMFCQFHKVVQEIMDEHGESDPSFYHWGQAEPSLYNGVLVRAEEHGIDDWTTPKFVDMHRIFRSEPIIIKGVYGFGLKSVASGLKNLGLISYPEISGNTSCANGMDAMIQATACYKRCANEKTPIIAEKKIQGILAYNELDCRMVKEIIGAARKINLSSSNASSQQNNQDDDGGGFLHAPINVYNSVKNMANWFSSLF